MMANGIGSVNINVQVSPGQKVTQFDISQDDVDMAGAELSCTSISCLAGRYWLQADGSVKKFMGDRAAAVKIIREGVNFHNKWLSLKEDRKAETTMACVDEVCNEVPEMGVCLKERWFAGGLAEEGYGKSLEGAIRDIYMVSKQSLSAFVLTTRGYSTMIGRKGRKAVIFDSHPRNKENGMAVAEGESGAAVLVEFEHAAGLHMYLQMLYGAHKNPDELYVMQEVGMGGGLAVAAAKKEAERGGSIISLFRTKSAPLKDGKKDEPITSVPHPLTKVVAAGGGSLNPLRRSSSWKERLGFVKSDPQLAPPASMAADK